MSDSFKFTSVKSRIKNIDALFDTFQISIDGNNKPISIAFFDIDNTLANLKFLDSKAIHNVFPDADQDELIFTFTQGFKLGSSFREFDRMCGIYLDGHREWKDPEVYIRERLDLYKDTIDTPDTPDHQRARSYLEKYGKEASIFAEALYKENPTLFEEAKIKPSYKLMDIFKKEGVMMFGFTANPKILVDRLSVYLNLSEYMIDIATDETIEGGGKEIAVQKMLKSLKLKGFNLPPARIIFVGDSIRGDVGSGYTFCKNNKEYKGYGIVVVSNNRELDEVRLLSEKDEFVKEIISNMPTYAFVTEDQSLQDVDLQMHRNKDIFEFLLKL